MHFNRRRLQLALGGLWLLDGLLQLQPYMFTTGFARNVLLPAGVGQPAPVHLAVQLAAAVISTHPALLDLVFAGAQLALGAGLLWRRTSRVALAGSVAWALGIWVTGEGMGGLLGGAGLFAGAPGAALLYAVLALAAWPERASGRPTAGPAGWLVPAWATLWLTLAAITALPGHHADRPQMLRGGPGTALLVAAEVCIGLFALRSGRWRAAATAAGASLGLLAWMTAEQFGGLASGQATDPNTGPLIALMALAVTAAQVRRRPTSVPSPTSEMRPEMTAEATRTPVAA